jgi:hypothetical protein
MLRHSKFFLGVPRFSRRLGHPQKRVGLRAVAFFVLGRFCFKTNFKTRQKRAPTIALRPHALAHFLTIARHMTMRYIFNLSVFLIF